MRLIIASKSPWQPSIRREHLIARSAAAEGVEVVFVERALDVRALRADMAPAATVDGVHVVPQRTLLPGHVSDLAEILDARRLARTLRRWATAGGTAAVIVATQPWQWPALAGVRGVRRAVDLADDWGALIPRRSGAVRSLHARIAREADAVVLASGALAAEFAPAPVTVVANGVDSVVAAVARTPVAPARRLVYAGTLSERFDAPLLGEVLDRLPGWEAELVGECQYAGLRGEPAPELRALLARSDGRISWRGPVARSELSAMLDRGRVLIAPHRSGQTRGQDSMKLYDYAVRGRAIVATPGALGPGAAAVSVAEAQGADAFAAAVQAAAGGDAPVPDPAWLAEHAWAARWPRWRDAVLGEWA